MITVADSGNTIIQIVTGGVEVAGGTQWTVYPYVFNDPTLQKFDREQQNRVKELSITDFRGKDDLSGHKMNEAIADAIAMLQRNVKLDRFKDLGLTVERIDVDPRGEIAKVLAEKYDIKPTVEGQIPAEHKA